MMLAFWERRAQQLRPYRKRLLVSTAIGILMFIGGAHLARIAGRFVAELVSALGMSTIVFSWGFFCVTYWFEPSKGSLSNNIEPDQHLGELTKVARWWAGMLAWIVLIVCGVVGPAWWVIGAARAA